MQRNRHLFVYTTPQIFKRRQLKAYRHVYRVYLQQKRVINHKMSILCDKLHDVCYRFVAGTLRKKYINFNVNVGTRYFKSFKILSEVLKVSYCAIKKKI